MSRPMRPTGIGWMGDVPSHWAVAPLFARYVVQLGKMLSPEAASGPHQAPYLGNADVQWGAINVAGLKTMSFAASERDRFRLRDGDLLVCEGGEVGRTAVWRSELLECFYQKALHRLRPRSDADAPQFLFYAMQAATGRGAFMAEGNTSTITHLTGEKLRAHRFPFPSNEEQRAIATFLDRKTAAIDALIAKKERLIELLQEKRQALITQAVTKGLDPNVPMKESGVEWLGRVPAHWDKWSVRDLLRMRYLAVQDGNHGELHPVAADYAATGIPFLMANNVRGGAVDLIGCKFIPLELAKTLRIGFARNGDVLLTHKGTLGETAILTGLTAPFAMLTPQVTYYRPLALLERAFLYFLLTSDFVQEQLRFISSVQSTRGYVGISAQRDVSFLIPPLNEQQRIVEHLTPEVARADAISCAARRSVEKLREYRQALITAAVTGKIDVSSEAAA